MTSNKRSLLVVPLNLALALVGLAAGATAIVIVVTLAVHTLA
jgi:hypothetical protein